MDSPPGGLPVSLIREIFASDDTAVRLKEVLSDVTNEEVVGIIPELTPRQRKTVLTFLPDRVVASLFDDLDSYTNLQILASLGRDDLVRVLEHIPPDEGADLLALHPDEDLALGALGKVTEAKRTAIQELLDYDPDSAAGIMTTEFAVLPRGLTVREALERIRTDVDDEFLHTLHIVDDAGVLVGLVSLKSLVKSEPGVPVEDLMQKDHVPTVGMEDEQEKVAHLLNLYDLVSIPVVDGDGRLRGIVTFDDALDVRDEEMEDDLCKIAGTGVLTLNAPLKERVMSRLPWLVVPLLGGLAASAILIAFEGTLDQVVALTAFIPIISGMAGNVGIQSSTLVVRALAVGHIERDRAVKTLVAELGAGILLGIACGGMTGVAAAMMKGQPSLGIVILISMSLSIAMAALVGTLAPLMCEFFKIDPAVAAGPFVTMLNDILALSAYLGIATWLMLP